MPGPVVIIGGPTGSGKNDLAIALGQHYPIEIINADSRQIYRELVIGTNQPSEEERRIVPHHLFGFVAPDRHFSAAAYEREALPRLTDIQQRKRVPVVIGGTGFYIRALLKGTWPVPPKDERLRQRLQEKATQKGAAYIRRMLTKMDPEAAARIGPKDVYRNIRAIETFLQTGKKRSQWETEHPDRFDALKFFVDPPSDELNRKLEQRLQAMFEAGWITEVRALLLKYPNLDALPAGASLGYPEIISYLKGALELDECKQLILQKTRQYAKRQRTWFRNQDGFERLPVGSELHKIIESLQLSWGK